MPEPREHTERRNWIETILRYVPGFRGYLEKEYRREADELQRQWLADRLERAKWSVDDLARPLADAGQIDALPQIDRLRGRLDKLLGRIRGAMQGYSGFFDLVRVDEPVLDRVYEHDVALMTKVDALATTLEKLPSRPAQIPEAVGELLARIDDVEQAWDVREDILKGLE